MAYAHQIPLVPAGSMGLLVYSMLILKPLPFFDKTAPALILIWFTHVVFYSFLLKSPINFVPKWKLRVSELIWAAMTGISLYLYFASYAYVYEFHNKLYLINGSIYFGAGSIAGLYALKRKKTNEDITWLIIANAIASFCFWVFMSPWLGEYI